MSLADATSKIQERAREKFIAELKAQGIDPFNPDPKIVNQGYTPIIGKSYENTRGLIKGYTKTDEEKTYTYDPSLKLSEIKQTIDGWDYKYAPNSSGSFYLTQIYNPSKGGANFDESGKQVAELMRIDGGGGGAMFKEALLLGASLLLPFAAPAITATVGSIVAPTAAAGTQAVIGNAIVQGAMAEAQGGDFLKGAALSAASSMLPGVNSSIADALGGSTAANVAAGALTSGALADLAGGDFKQGALMGGIGAGVNEAKLDLATDQLNSMEGGFGPYESNLPTELDVIAAFPELAPPPVFDTSFTPDYSLATGAPVIPDMGAQGIQVPTINELVDVVGQPVDYSLPIPNSGLGLQMPTAPNLDSMGGGQGLVIPVDGGVITEAGFIPDAYVPNLGDPNSFINQPAPNVEVNIPELSAEQPKDISGELAALDLVKALAPFAVTAALAKDQPQATTDEQTGYPILPIPSEWKAPEYNMAFTPSAALDFGSPDLLQGTQWANQQVQPAQMNYSLSDVMNTLNYQSVPFVQQQMQPFEQSFSVPDILQQFQTRPSVGMNDIIGGLNGRQVSISDIISGIQSQYGQKAAS